MEEIQQKEVYNLSDKKNKRRPKRSAPDWWKVTPPEKLATGPPKPKYGRGLNPNSHKHGKGGAPKGRPRPEGAGRKARLTGEKTTVAFRASKDLMDRLRVEASRRGMSRNELFNNWLESLPAAEENL